MKAITLLAAAAAALSFDAALAAAPKLSGKYSLTSTHLCQVMITSDGSGQISNVGQSHNIKIGTATMSGGNLSYSGVMIEGASLLINNVGQKMTQSTVFFSGAFATTATTFTFDGKIFQARYADIDANGVAHHATFMLRDDLNCATISTAVRQ
jgi:hypothetical protein